MMNSVDIEAWKNVSDTVFVPHTEADYDRLVAMLDDLVDEVGEEESHPLASLMDVVSALVENYENTHVPELILEELGLEK